MYSERPAGDHVTTAYRGGSIPGWSIRATETQVAGGSLSIVQHDRLGRDVYTSTRNTRIIEGESKLTVVRRFFDVLGRQVRQDIPFEEDFVGQRGTQPGRNGEVVNEFDELDRVVKTRTPDGAQTETRWVDLLKVVRDPEGRTRYVVTDDLGREVETGAAVPFPGPTDPDVNLSGQGTMRYRFTAHGHVRRASDSALNETRMTYDNLGRRIGIDDPDTGPTSTKYNGFGEAREETNARAKVTTLEHDILGRVLKQSDEDGETVFDWDSALHGVGQMALSRSPDGTETSYEYDVLGRPVVERARIEGNVFEVRKTYDSFGRTGTVSYPGAAPRSVPGTPPPAPIATVMRYEYHPRNGSLLAVRDALDPLNRDSDRGNDTSYWYATERDEQGRRVREHYGNGTETQRTYDPHRGWLETLVTFSGANNLQVLDYFYDRSGNMNARRESRPDSAIVNEAFDYDEMSRLAIWRRVPNLVSGRPLGPFTWRVEYNWNDIGNLGGRTVYAANNRADAVEDVFQRYPDPMPGLARPHAVTSREWNVGNGEDGAYTYDDSGRQTGRPGQRLTYTAFDLPRSLAQGPEEALELAVDYKYTAGGGRALKRVRRGIDTETTTYVGGLFELREKEGSTFDRQHVYYLMAGDRIIGQITRTEPALDEKKVEYFHEDHLGSVSLTTNAAGVSESPVVYHDPFGNRYNPDQPPRLDTETEAPLPGVTKGFTGHEMDNEVALINMNGRMFDPQTARFLTADPVVQDPTSSQSYNRYMYTWGNPLRYVDATGFQVGSPRGNTEGSSIGPRISAAGPLKDFSCPEYSFCGVFPASDMVDSGVLTAAIEAAFSAYRSYSEKYYAFWRAFSALADAALAARKAQEKAEADAKNKKKGGQAPTDAGAGPNNQAGAKEGAQGGGVDRQGNKAEAGAGQRGQQEPTPEETLKRTNFKTGDAAAKAALDIYAPKTTGDKVEYIGYVYQTEDGQIRSTAGYQGKAHSADFYKPLAGVPKGAPIIGFWHTHPTQENFSQRDIQTVATHSTSSSDFYVSAKGAEFNTRTAWLSDPKGLYRKYERPPDSATLRQDLRQTGGVRGRPFR